MKRSPDWSIDELADSVWDGIGTSQVCIQAKPVHKVENDFYDRGISNDTVIWNEEKLHYFPFTSDKYSNIDELSSSHAEDSFFCKESNRSCISNSDLLSSQDTAMLDGYDVDKIGSYSDALEYKNIMNSSLSCSFHFENVSQTANYKDIIKNEQMNSKEDIMFLERPEFDNFEDFDKTFRNCDLIHGGKQKERADETSWSPAISAINDHSEVPCTSNLPASCSHIELLDDNAKFSQPTSENQVNYQFGGDWMDNHAQEVKLSMPTIGNQQYYGAMKLQEYLDDNKIPSHSSCVLQETDIPGVSDYSHISPSSPHFNINYNFSSNQTYLAHYMSDNQLSTEHLKLPRLIPENKQQLLAPITTQPQQDVHEVETLATLLETAEVSAVQEKLFLTAVSFYDIPNETTSFHQLCNVMDQFDIRTKLCIRDSFYRFATSAKKRYKTSNYSKEHIDTRNQLTEASNRYINRNPENMTAESATNLVDNFMANLLFQRVNFPASESCGVSTNI